MSTQTTLSPQATRPTAGFPGPIRALFTAFARHGRPVRGLMSTAKSPSFSGSFGRMFRYLPAAVYGKTDSESRANLLALGAAMTSDFDAPKDGLDAEESGIPALYTYFGQFIDHDLTFDPMSTLMKQSDPDALTDFRTPALDLDNVYGRGPGDQPYMYDADGRRLLLGKPLANGALDLQRNGATPARALIGDPRNDENSIVSQFQGIMLRFHNRVADDNPHLELPDLQQIVRWHYQWVLLHDFLPRIVRKEVLDALKGSDGAYEQSKLKFFHWKNQPFMPVEFSVCAYRLGHSMIRPGYRLNDDDSTLLPIFPVISQNLLLGLTGFTEMASNRGIDWGRFINLPGDVRAYGQDPDDPKVKDKPTTDMKRRLQFAYRIDTSLVTPLSLLPPNVTGDGPPAPQSLPQRNLIRALELGLPSGQDVARAMGVPVLADSDIKIGKAVDKPGDGDVRGTIDTVKGLEAFKGKCPLWTYILAEAFHKPIQVQIPVKEKVLITTPQLGAVGGRIVAEVFLGMLFGDKNSYLSAHPKWTPTISKGADFTLGQLVSYALGR